MGRGLIALDRLAAFVLGLLLLGRRRRRPGPGRHPRRPLLQRSPDTDRGEVVAELKPTINPDTDLDQLRLAVEQVFTGLHEMVGRDELRTRVLLRTARRRTTAPRVI